MPLASNPLGIGSAVQGLGKLRVGMAEGSRVDGRRKWPWPLIRSVLLRKRRPRRGATRARHFLAVSRLPLPQVGRAQTGAGRVLWVAQYSIEVDFSSLAERTITSIINLLLVYFRRDFSDGRVSAPGEWPRRGQPDIHGLKPRPSS